MGVPQRARRRREPREHRLDVKAQVLKRGGEQQIVLKAVSTTLPRDHLALEVSLLERDRDALVGIEILERDRGGVRAVDRLPGRRIGPPETDPLQVGVEVEHRRVHPISAETRFARVGANGIYAKPCAERKDGPTTVSARGYGQPRGSGRPVELPVTVWRWQPISPPSRSPFPTSSSRISTSGSHAHAGPSARPSRTGRRACRSAYLRDLCAYWKGGYEWRRAEASTQRDRAVPD